MHEIEVTNLWEAASRVQTVDQYKHWIKSEVRLVLPHGAFACGCSQVNSAGGISFGATANDQIHGFERSAI